MTRWRSRVRVPSRPPAVVATIPAHHVHASVDSTFGRLPHPSEVGKISSTSLHVVPRPDGDGASGRTSRCQTIRRGTSCGSRATRSSRVSTSGGRSCCPAAPRGSRTVRLAPPGVDVPEPPASGRAARHQPRTDPRLDRREFLIPPECTRFLDRKRVEAASPRERFWQRARDD